MALSSKLDSSVYKTRLGNFIESMQTKDERVSILFSFS